jgi:hypothetical protein
MQQYNIATNNALIANIEHTHFEDIHALKDCVLVSIQKICDFSEEIAGLITEDNVKQVINNSKELNPKDDNNSITASQKIDEIYKIRYKYVQQLSYLVNYYKNKFNNNIEFLFSNNQQWDRYLSQIVSLESSNMEYLKTKSAESKNKLSKIINNKSLLLYNKKVELNYENKLL